MAQYRVKGLSCAHCTQELEQRIRELAHGDAATLSYASGKLTIEDEVSMAEVEKILASEGAALERGHEEREHKHEHRGEGHGHAHEHGHGHGHGHDHAHGAGKSFFTVNIQLIAAAVLYAAALVLEIGFSAPGLVAVVLYAASIVISGYTTFMKGIRNLARLRFTIDTLMSVALIGAVALGDWKEATLVAILFGINEWLEGYGMDKARRSIEALLRFAPKEATLLADDGEERVVPIAALQTGDLVLVRPGGQIPSDGTVESGRSSVNEAALTGESLPVDKSAGSPVFGGSINNEGALRVRIGKPYRDSALAGMLHLIEEAQETKTPTELFINRFSRYYTPFIMIVAALVIVVPPLVFGGDWLHWLYQGMATLIVGCPCALLLSSPVALVAGISRSARIGVLVKGGVHLEQLGKLDALAFDKTGTLTAGEPRVEREAVYDEERFYAVAAAIESASSHPLARAVLAHIGKRAGGAHASAVAQSVVALPGQGMEATVGGAVYRLGNESVAAPELLTGDARRLIAAWKAEGLTLVVAAAEDRLLGLFGIADALRPESAATVAALRRQGIRRIVMLTGDHGAAAQRVATAVGVGDVRSGLLPEDKVAAIRELAQSGRVAMIGDGINDAPALAAAHLGIAMGKGTDSAMETADIVLMQDHLGKLPMAVSIARRVNRIVKLNLAFAIGLKAAALLLAIPGWLTLWFAILSDMGATVLVTLTSLTVLAAGWRSKS